MTAVETQRDRRQESGRLIRAREVAEILNVSLRTVYRLGDSGQLPRYRIGTRSWRYSYDGVLAYLDSQAIDVAPAERDRVESVVRSYLDAVDGSSE